MAQNVGKRFEQQFKLSVPDYCLLVRIPDPPQSFVQSKSTRFSVKNPFDFIMFDSIRKVLYCIELKTTKYKSISYEDIELDTSQNKMIHKHQILGLLKSSDYQNVKSGFLINFRDEDDGIERTYFQDINDFITMSKKINKKSFNELDLIVDGNAIKIDGKKKRVNYIWDIDKFLNKIMEV